MPVPTETLRNIKVLNLVFAASAVLLLFSVLGLVLDDWTREWRQYQQDAKVWDTAMLEAQQTVVISYNDQRLEELNDQIDQINQLLDESLDGKELPEQFRRFDVRTIDQAKEKIKELKAKNAKLTLPAAKTKGELTPLNQQIEQTKLLASRLSDKASEDDPKLQKQLRKLEQLRSALAKYQTKYNELKLQMDANAASITYLQKGIDEARSFCVVP